MGRMPSSFLVLTIISTLNVFPLCTIVGVSET
jgi:hypothetical protein